MALRSMGLSAVLDAAKQLAESGAVQKIIQFADGLEETNERLARIEEALGITKDTAQAPLLIGNGTDLRRLNSDEPGSNAGARDVA